MRNNEKHRNNRMQNGYRRWKKQNDNKKKNNREAKETEEQQKALFFESQEQQDEKHKQELEDRKAWIEEKKQLQEHTTPELSLLCGDLGDLCDELNGQEKSSIVEKYVSNIPIKISVPVNESVVYISEQIKSEVEETAEETDL